MKSQHIANGQVKRADLARNAVNSSRVANRSLRDSSEFGQVIHEAVVPWDPGGISAGTCDSLAIPVPSAVQDSDHLLMTYDDPGGSSVLTQLTGMLFLPGGVAFAILCNHSPGVVNPPNFNVNVLVLR